MAKFISWIKKYDIWLIMLLGFIVRLIGYKWMDYTNFPEFYRDYYMVSHIAHGSLVLLGPASMLHGFHFGPFYYYSLVPFFILFNGHPFGLIFTGIIFSVLTIYAFFKILLLWFNSRAVARTGALFAAFSVYSLHLASYTSNPNFLPLFVLWYFYYLTKILGMPLTASITKPMLSSRPSPNASEGEWRDPSTPRLHSSVGMTKKELLTKPAKQSKDYLLLGFAFGLATQLHATAMIVLPLVTLTALIVHKYRFTLKNSLYFLLAGILSYAPYLVFELTHGFTNIKRLFILGTKELDGSHYTSGVAAIWNFFQGTLTPFNNWYSYTNIQPNILYIFVALFALIAMLDLLFKIFKKQEFAQNNYKISGEGRTILLAWIFFTCVVLLLFARGVHDHYIIILWPAPLIILAFVIFWLKSKFNVFASMLTLIIITAVLQIYSFYQTGHIPWREFMPIYKAQYQDAGIASVSEIGS